jgi:hypothetical protein
MITSRQDSKQVCPNCAAEHPKPTGQVTDCPKCGAKLITAGPGAETLQPVQSVWGAPFPK